MKPGNRRTPLPIIHVGALVVLATLTNASALMPSTFGGDTTTILLAILTLICAGMEHVVRRMELAQVPLPVQTEREHDALKVHIWGCALAAFVGFACALYVILT